MLTRLRFRLQGLYRDRGVPVRRLARCVRRELSILAYRGRSAVAARPEPARVVPTPLPERATRVVPHPAIAVVAPTSQPPGTVGRFLAGQTETSLTTDPVAAAGATFCFTADGELDRLPATLLESLVLAAVTGDLSWATAGWAPPAPSPSGPEGVLRRPKGVPQASLSLVRLPTSSPHARGPVLGRAVPHVTAADRLGDASQVDHAGVATSGPYLLDEGARTGTVIRHGVHSPDTALGALPEVAGPPTALFLLPFLAVGGAERLLFDLLQGLGESYRLLVVTVEPHQACLGQTVDACRQITPHVYTIGDWLPREAHHHAIRHLVRRWRVDSLVSWNGTTCFYDHLAELRRGFPRLRILNQLFNHEGGWIEHYSPRIALSVDVHIAVNRRIAAAFADRSVPPERVTTIHHAVRLPPEATPGERAERRASLRASLGLPPDTVVVGSFLRLHPQKRPLDIVRLARHMTAHPVHFLIVGGGPLDEELDRELAAHPAPNLTRLGMHSDASTLYDAIDICLLTSSYEGLPVFLLDGLARGLPCVATAVGEIPELLQDGGGIVVDRPGDLAALQAGILALLDEGRRSEEGRRGRRTVAERFAMDRYVRAYEAVIFPPSAMEGR